MGKFILSLALALSFSGALLAAPWDLPDVLRDPKTKVTYRLDRDRLHIEAFSADGKSIWRTNVTLGYPAGSGEERTRIISWCFWQHVRPRRNEVAVLTGDEYLQVSIGVFHYACVCGSIDKRTGKFYPLITS